MTAHVLALQVDLRIPSARSLKDRRAVVTPLLEGARHRYAVSAADTGDDRRQRAELTFAVVSGGVARATEVMDSVERFVWSFPAVEVVSSRRRWLDVN